MNTSTRRLLGGLATAAVLLIGPAGLVSAADPASPAPAPSGPTGDEMLSVVPSLISVQARPGGTAKAELTLRAAAPLDVTVQAMGLQQTPDGNFASVAEAQDTSPFSARAMLTAAPGHLQLAPGDEVKLAVDVSLPEDVGEGTRYGVITITGLPAGADENVGFGVELGVSAIVTVQGTPQEKTGEIEDITVGESLPGQPLPVTVAFANTGNTHYGAQPNELITTATLQDASGAVVASANEAGGRLSVIPPFTRDLALTMAPSIPLSRGSYHLEVGVGLKDGTIFDRKAIDFEWSGGDVLSETGAPVTNGTTSTPGQSYDGATLVAVALLTAALVAVVFVLLSRVRSRRSREAGPES